MIMKPKYSDSDICQLFMIGLDADPVSRNSILELDKNPNVYIFLFLYSNAF